MQHQFMVKNVISSMKNLALNTVSIAVIFAVLFIFVLYISGIEHAKQELNAGDIIGILLMISWLIIAVYGLVWVHWTSESEDIESVRQKQAAIEEQREKTHIMNGQYNAKDDIFYTAQTSLNQLEEYYRINKNQARRTFTASIIAISVGMASIIFGIWQIYFNNLIIGALPTIAGVVGQFIGAGYFYMHRTSINQLNIYFKQLTNLQDRMLAIYLCLDLKDEKQKSEIMEEIIMFLLKDTTIVGSQPSTIARRK